eukprot:Rmarinus@m.1918
MAIHEILQIIAFSATVIFQVSGLQPVLGYWRDQSVPSSASPVPFFSMVASSCAWSLYGGLTSDLSILLANLFGVVLGLFYCYSFCSLSKKDVTWHSLATVVLVMIPACVVYTHSLQESRVFVGYFASALAVILLSSPLVSIGEVVRTQSTASMPFFVSASAFFCALSWTSYGALLRDSFVLVPNFLGLAGSSVQMGLFLLYGKERTGRMKKDEDALERV